MERVSKIIAYHISIEGGFSCGDSIIAGKKKNGVYRKYVRALLKVKKSSNDRRRCLIQYHLEKIRKRYYSEYPSRFTALYVQLDKAKSMDILNIWKQNGYKSAQILTLELHGHIHKCAHQKLSNEDYPTKDEIRKKSHDYWNGVNGEEEYLFVGCANVVNVENIM